MKQIDLIDWDHIRFFRYGENRRFESTEGFALQIRNGEFVCPRYGEVKLDATFVLKLDLASRLVGTSVPFVITYCENRRFESTRGFASQIRYGYRCPAHNAEVGGVKQSAHMTGLAADIACPDSVTRLKILRGLIVAGFRRIGIGKNFIHGESRQARVLPLGFASQTLSDVDTTKPNSVWLYEDR